MAMVNAGVARQSATSTRLRKALTGGRRPQSTVTISAAIDNTAERDRNRAAANPHRRHMKRSTDRILTTHVGSLVRPQDLLDLSAQAKRSGDHQPYQDGLRRSVSDIVQMQAKAGIDVVNDGEFGKSGWANYALGRVSGFEERPDKMYPAVWLGRDRFRFADFMAKEFPRGVTGTPGHACIGPIAYRDHASIARDVANLQAAVKSADVEDAFFTAVAPASVGYDAANEYYANERDYVFAIANALREEYLAVINA